MRKRVENEPENMTKTREGWLGRRKRRKKYKTKRKYNRNKN